MAVSRPSLLARAAPSAVITSIDALKRDPNLRAVKVNGRTAATLAASSVSDLGLAPGQQWTEPLAGSVARLRAMQAARAAAMRMLGKRSLSRAEVVERLVRKRHDPAVASATAQALANDGWIDEAGLGRAVAEGAVRRGPAAASFIAAKVRERKLDEAIVSDSTREHAPADDVLSAVALAESRLRSLRNRPTATQARRVAAALGRRGFDDETIDQALRRLGLDPRGNDA